MAEKHIPMSVATRQAADSESILERVMAYLMVVRSLLAQNTSDAHALLDELVGANAAGSRMSILGAVKMVGAAVIGIAVTVLVVNEVLTVEAINNTSGPFAGVIDSIETTGVAAMTLLVIALVVVAASYIMGVMDRF